jgi:hypothetical protein
MQKLAGIMIILFCAIPALPAQDVQNIAKSAEPEPRTSQYADTDANDPKADLAKMQVLLGQMQRNVAFVSTGDTPLKHQFQLEIEMWQHLLRDMERKLNTQQAVPAK